MEHIHHPHWTFGSAEIGSIIFEIYPVSEKSGSSEGARIGFSVSDVDLVFDELVAMGTKVISSPRDSQWGQRAVVKDFDGHSVELVAPRISLKD